MSVRTSGVHFSHVVAALEIFADVVETCINVDVFPRMIVLPQLAIGAGIGGKRGALIGAGSGVGGYLVYRYVRDRRGRCVQSYSR